VRNTARRIGVTVTGLLRAVAFQRRPLSTLIEAQRTAGDSFPMRTLVGGRMWVVAAPTLADEVLRGPPGLYRAGSANRRILPVLPDDTVLTLDGEAHRARRRVLAPLFRGESLAAMTPIIRDIAAAEIARWPVGAPFVLLPRTRFMTLCIAARLLLGIEGPRPVGELARHLSDALRPYSMLAGIDRLAWLGPASPQAAAGRCRAGFARGLSRVRDASGPRPGDGPPDALDMLGVTARAGPAFDDARVAGELFALLLAGHETTATAIAWALELLAHDPATTARLAAEAATEQRPLVDAEISEVLRLRPPLVDIVRQLAEPVRLADQRLAAGTIVLIPPPLIHRHGHPEPDTFKADRFLAHRPNPRTWLPFGGGDRRCLGASLALLELREIVGHIVQRFEIEPADERPERASLHGTALIPARGARVVLRPR